MVEKGALQIALGYRLLKSVSEVCIALSRHEGARPGGGGREERNFRRVEVEPAKLGTFSSSYSIPLRYGGKVEREGRIPTERRMKIRFKLHDDKSEHNL